jgi:hypothetical protein
MRCPHCQNTRPEKGYCCEKAELEVLRTVMDEVARHLHSEVTTASAIGVEKESVAHARDRLRGARAA